MKESRIRNGGKRTEDGKQAVRSKQEGSRTIMTKSFGVSAVLIS